MDPDPEASALRPAGSPEPVLPAPDSFASAHELLAAGRLLLGQIASMRTELQRLSASLLQQSATIIEALDDLEAAAVSRTPAPEPPAPVGPPPAASVESPPPPPPAPPPLAEPPLAAPPGPAEAPRPAEPSPPAEPPRPAGPANPLEPPRVDAAGEAAREDARLVALDMALGGRSREQIDEELAARFDLPDRAALVDEVLAAIG